VIQSTNDIIYIALSVTKLYARRDWPAGQLTKGEMIMKIKVANVSLLLVLLLIPFSASAALWTGDLQGVQGSQGAFYWGDGVNDLFQEWSVNRSDCCGWFYGSSYMMSSNADVYVFEGLADPTTVTDASVFSYHDSSSRTYPGPYGESWAAWAQEGDTVFFRGLNGNYGAWYIEDIYYDASNPMDYAALDGKWYFLDDGSADFSVVPLPGAVWLLGSGLAGLVGARIRRKK
jgi:hypothetical protein